MNRKIVTDTRDPMLMAVSPPERAAVCFIVPTLKRGPFLRRCLHSILAQTVRAERVLVGIKSGDDESLGVVAEFTDLLSVEPIEAKGVGVIGSMSSCLAKTTEEFVALVDDDVELPTHWLATMLYHLVSQSEVLAAAGRDFLQDHPKMRREEKKVLDVGTFHWYGRITGNHHRGAGEPRRVDILRGSNCLFRGSFLRETGFEHQLRGKGAQVNWELALAFQAMQRGKRFYYDPRTEVIHHAAPRMDRDVLHRGGFDTQSTSDNAYNETFVIKAWAPGIRKWTSLAYQVIVGTPHAPGLLHLSRQICRLDSNTLARIRSTAAGRTQALLMPRTQRTALVIQDIEP